MKVTQRYSHLNGEEFLIVHKKDLYDEVHEVIAAVDASSFKTKVSREQGREGILLYSPGELNKEFARLFRARGWRDERRSFFVSPDPMVVKDLEPLDFDAQRRYLESIGAPLIRSFNQTDFVKDSVAVEVQMGKYFAVTYDLFVKHLSFYTVGMTDVGIEIVPTKRMQSEMSSGPPFFEKEVHNVLRHGRTTPPVPLVVLGIEP